MLHPGLLLFFAVVSVVGAVVSAILVTASLNQRGIQTPFFFMGALLFRNLERYKEITLKETGEVGPLFYWYVVLINAAWILALAAAAVRVFQFY